MLGIDQNIEARNLKYLTKKLFEAAHLDAKTDFLTNNKPGEAARLDAKTNFLTNNNPGEAARLDAKTNFLTNKNPFLDRFLDQLQEQLGREKFTDKNKRDFKDSLSSQYSQLKEELKEARVFGVGKSATNKVKTIVNNFKKIIPSFVKGISKIALDVVSGNAPKLTNNKKIGMRKVLQGGGINLSKTIIKFNNNQGNSKKSRYFGL